MSWQEIALRYYSRKRISSKDRPISIGMFIFKVPVSSKGIFSLPEPRGGGWGVCSRVGSTGLFSLARSGVSKSLSCCCVPWPQLPSVFPFWFERHVTESSVFTDILEQLSRSVPSADKPQKTSSDSQGRIFRFQLKTSAWLLQSVLKL